MIKIIKIIKTHCISLIQGVPESVMDTYCWLHSTFTLPHLGVVEIDNVYGIDQFHFLQISILNYKL